MSSPYIVDISAGATPCTEKNCEPFFIREWETMIFGTLLMVVVMYLMGSCAYDRFVASKTPSANPYVALGSANRMMSYDSRVNHEHTGFDRFAAQKSHYLRTTSKFDAAPAIDYSNLNNMIKAQTGWSPADIDWGQVKRGLGIPSQGAATETFMDFDAIDKIDGLPKDEPIPTHQPSTPDEQLNPY